MAALSASRLVCSEMAVIVSTMPPMRVDFSPSWRIAALTSADEVCTPRMASSTLATACSPTSAEARASAATWAVSAAFSRRVAAGRRHLLAHGADLVHGADLLLGAARDLADGLGDLADGATDLLGGRGHLDAGAVQRGGGAGDGADDLGDAVAHLDEGVAQRVALGARLDLDGEVARAHLGGGAGGLTQVVDDLGEGVAHGGDLVAAVHVEVLVDVALGQVLGGIEHLAHAAHDAAPQQETIPMASATPTRPSASVISVAELLLEAASRRPPWR